MKAGMDYDGLAGRVKYRMPKRHYDGRYGLRSVIAGVAAAPVNASTQDPVTVLDARDEANAYAMMGALIGPISIRPIYEAQHSLGVIGSIPCICKKGPVVGWESEYQYQVGIPVGTSPFIASHLYLHQVIRREHMHYSWMGFTYKTYTDLDEFLPLDPETGIVIDDHWDVGNAVDCAISTVATNTLELVVMFKAVSPGAESRMALDKYEKGSIDSSGGNARRQPGAGYPKSGVEYGMPTSEGQRVVPVAGVTATYREEYFPWHCPWGIAAGAVASNWNPPGGGTPTPGGGGERQSLASGGLREAPVIRNRGERGGVQEEAATGMRSVLKRHGRE